MKLNANLENIKENDFEPLPAGWYNARVSDSEIKTSKSGNNYVAWTFELQNGRLVWDNMVLNNDISLRRLKTLAAACGHSNPNYIADSEELHGLECQIKLAIEEQDGYEPRNVVKSFKPLEGRTMKTPPSAPAVASPTPAGMKEKPKMPWEK